MTTYSTAVLADSPLFYYRMEEANGALVNSGSAGGTITKNGSPTWVTGADGRGFTVGSGYFVINSSNDYASDKAFSIEFLIKAGTQATGIRTIMQRGTTAPYMTVNLLGNNQASPGKLEWAYYTGSGQRVLTTTARVDTGSWVHVVLASTGSTMTIYINGSVDTSGAVGSGSGSITANTYIGNNTTATQPANLDIDEFAIYDGNVGSTIANHAAVTRVPVSPNTDISVSVSPLTGSGTAPGGVQSIPKSVSVTPAVGDGAMPDVVVQTNRNKTIAVDPMTGSGTSPDATGAGNIAILADILDKDLRSSTASGSATTTRVASAGQGYNAYFKFASPAKQVVSATLNFPVVSATGTNTAFVQRVTSAWTETSTTDASTVDILTGAQTLPSSGTYSIDITSVVNGWFNNTFANHGVALFVGSTYNTWITGARENSDPALRPYISVQYVESDKIVSVIPMTGSGLANDVTVTKQTRVDASPMTGSGDFVLPAVSVEVTPNVNLFPEPMNGSGTMPGGVFTSPRNVAVSPLEGSGNAPDVSVTTFINAIPVAAPMIGSGYLVPNVESGNIADDRYFARIKVTTDDDDYIGFGSTEGFKRYVGGSGTEGTPWTIVGSWSNGIFGPESRRAINLPGSYVNNDSNKPPMFEWTFETVLRTTDADGTLISGLDISGTSSAQYSIDIALSGGKVSVAKFTQSVIGRNRVDDGNWHHILITFGGGSGINTGLRVFIDGQLDIRRELFGIDSTTSQWAGPDRFFGNLNADVESFVFRRSADMDEPAIVQNYYAAMGIYPIAAAPMVGSGSMPNARGKGNQKRALMLYFVWRYDNNAFGQPVIPRVQELNFNRFPGDFEFGPNLGVDAPSDFAGYKVFPVNANGGYRDEITDFPRLIDLEKDLNIDDYDLILFRNWPNENTEIDALAANGVTRDKLEKLLTSVRWAVDQGKGFLITDPGLANDFGVIQSAAAVPVMGEKDFVDYQGNAAGDYDRRSYDVDPWKVPASAQFPADYRAHFYRDTHANNRERVAATIAGLTDLPSYTLVDWTIRDERDPFKLGGIRSLKYEQKDALEIGYEFVNLTVPAFQAGEPDPRGARRDYIWAVPPAGVKAGKAVTTLGNTIFTGGTEVANPYANWAVSIALEPGDNLNGTPIGGKIFVNIGEEIYNDGIPEPASIQLVPDNSNIPNPSDWEDADKRAWQYSMNRWDIGYTSPGGGSGGSSNQDGSVDAGAGKTGNWSPDLAGVSASEKYPLQPISIHTMMSRGLVWLGEVDDRQPGDAVIRPSAMIGSGEMKQPTTTAQKPAVVNVPAIIGNGQMVNPVEARDGNVLIQVLPMEGSGTVTGYNKSISIEPMLGSGEMVDNFNLVFAGGEQVILVLHNIDAILTIEEGT
ncbi:hypothetical protein SEA_MINIFLAYER_8 [Satellite phage MiniFlayer]|nr:hypothetical protein SEA_MINIFLAYER_8 [Satellite phage MiniFlayer]